MYAYSNPGSSGSKPLSRSDARSNLPGVGPAVNVFDLTPTALNVVYSKSAEALVTESNVIDLKRTTDARRLFELEQLEVSFEKELGALWTFMRPRGRPSYNPDLLEDFQ